MPTKASLTLAILAIAIATSTTMVAVGFTQHNVLADPWSWGGHPSKN
ncbi:MAG: hypothetical protein WCC17_07340 [Candidatus Nitrosopolaris sp.]